MNKQSTPQQPSSISTAKKVGFGLITGLLVTSISASVFAAHHGEGKQGFKRGPLVLSEMEQRIDERFSTADVNSDGQLSPEELATIKPNRKMHGKHKRGKKDKRPDTDAVFDTLDSDASGQLTREEFTADKQRAARKRVKMEQRFAKLDADGSGAIERHEFGGRLERLRAADTDADGTVTREEMRAARKAHRAQKQIDNS